MPAEIDEANRQLTRMQIEAQALARETSSESKQRLGELKREIADREEEVNALKSRWQAEKESLGQLKPLKEEIEKLRMAYDQAFNKAQQSHLNDDYIRAYEAEQKLRAAEKRLAELEARFKEINQSPGERLLREEVTEEDIARVVSLWTGIPVSRMLQSEREKLLRMETEIHKRMIDQDEAIEAVSNAVRRSRSGLQDRNRPIGSFIFLGPTGVGKTELAKALAWFLFDDETAMIRLDMSEYMEKHSVSRLIGAPPGYVGYEEGGALTEAVRRRPYQVVLFDEIEKAHPDVFNVLLQVLDEGRLTDGQAHTVDFRNTLIVMTSNLGAEFLVNQPEGQDTDAVREPVMAAVRARFRPEFLNRVDEVILFHRLKRDQMARIVDIQIRQLDKLLAERKIAVALDAAARDWLAERGYDPTYGARPLKRVIQKHLQDPLAEVILSGRVRDGDKVAVSATKFGLTFNGKVAAAA